MEKLSEVEKQTINNGGAIMIIVTKGAEASVLFSKEEFFLKAMKRDFKKMITALKSIREIPLK